MTSIQKEAWQKVRSRGRGIYLLTAIGKNALIVTVLYVCWQAVSLLLHKTTTNPWWEQPVQFAALALTLGLIYGRQEWQEKENDYLQSVEERGKHLANFDHLRS